MPARSGTQASAVDPGGDADVTKLLREAGLRRTKPRVLVLGYLLRIRHPMAHAELASALEAKGAGRVTVYRALVDFVRAGLLSRSDVGDHVWRFELTRGDRSHYREHAHFVCVRCGAVACLSSEAVDLRAEPRMPKSLRARRVEVQIRGECDACASRGGYA